MNKWLTGSMLSAILVSPFANVYSQKQAAPNILIIMTDQQRWDALRYSGANDIIETPNLDKLAQNGAYFSQASSPCPVCGPARTAILTGRYVETNGIRNNGDADIDKKCEYKTFDQLLTENGYVSEYIGKFHSPAQMADIYSNPSQYGYSGSRLIKSWERMYNFYLKEHAKKRQPASGELVDFSFFDGLPYKPTPIDRRFEKLPSGIIPESELANRQLTQPDHNGTLDLNPEYSITAVQGRQTIEAIERMKNQKFSITCSFHCPHSPILPTEPFASMYNPSKMPIPKSIADKMEGNPYVKSNGRLFATEYADSAKIGYMIANYYALITEIDQWVGKIISKLDELKLSDNTLIVFVSDHGEMLGAHGMREKNVFLEESVRVPLILNYPGKIPSGKIDTPVSTLNIFSTVLDYAGIKAESDGYSLKSLAEGEKPVIDFAISEWNYTPNQKIPNLMIRTKEWKLMISRSNENSAMDALYDLKNDPNELNNLLFTNKEKYRKTAELMKNKLYERLAKSNYSYAEEIKQRIF